MTHYEQLILVNYTPTNSAIDVVVIEQPDGTLLGSPFHVNFGVRSVLHATDKKVFITVTFAIAQHKPSKNDILVLLY